MFLHELKENIRINSKPFAALRNEVVQYLISHEDALITNDTISDILHQSDAYSAAKYDIQNRFLSFSAGHSIEEALFVLLSNNHDLVYELHTIMGEKVDPKVAAIAYGRILSIKGILQCIPTASLENSKKSFYEAQDFLSGHENFTALAVHFKCTKRLGSMIEIFSHVK